MDCFSTKRSLFFKFSIGFEVLCLILISFTSFGQARYVWKRNGAAAYSWADGDNWEPVRSVLANNDILVFDGINTPTVNVNIDFVTAQTVGQLIFIDKVQVALNTDADRGITFGAQPSATAFQIEAGTLVQVIGTQGGAGLTLQLAANSRANISGRLEFLGTTGLAGCPHQLLSNTPGAVEFMSGSYFLGGSKFVGSPFGALKSSTGAVVFYGGATFEQASGGNAFGDKTWSVAVFKPGSLYLYTAGSNTIGLSGRTFGNLTLNTNRTPTAATYGTEKLVIQNDLTVLAGIHTINVKDFDLSGNIILSGGSLVFAPDVVNTTLTLTFNGAGLQAQTIGGTAGGALALGPNVALVLNNPAGLTLQRPVQVNGNLMLAQGLLTTTTANSLTLGTTATKPSGSATSFVNGPLSWLVASSGNVNLFFPIGSGKAYRPLTLTGQQTSAAPTTYTAQQLNQAPTGRTFPTAAGSAQRVSKVRYFTVTNNGAANFTQGAVTLNYDADDRVDAPAKLRVAKSDNAGNWLDLGGPGTGAPAGSITSAVPFTAFGDFVLASTEANGTPGNDPLPVTLATFVAQRQAAGVRLRWETASELNNSHFEVQRSGDGRVFNALASVPGHGSSAAAQVYSYLDATAPAKMLYYQLHQVDEDGTSSYSPVEVVRPEEVLADVYPNPASQEVHFHAPSGSAYRVLNVLGQPVLAGCATAENNTLLLHALPPGVYYLEIVSAHDKKTCRFFKQA